LEKAITEASIRTYAKKNAITNNAISCYSNTVTLDFLLKYKKSDAIPDAISNLYTAQLIKLPTNHHLVTFSQIIVVNYYIN